MASISLIILLFVFKFVVSEDVVRSLCDDPNINGADRLPNNTYRVYRGNYYWELFGLPTQKAKVEGPFPIWYEYMAPMDAESSVQTVITGSATGMTFKYKRDKYWMYNSKDGKLVSGGKVGFNWNLFPPGGFNAVLNDGGMNGTGYPVMIGFQAFKVYYYNANDKDFKRIGSSDGYLGGKDGEKFPGDLKAAFAVPSNDKGVKYYVYLFNGIKQYCFRPVVGVDGCEWKPSTELFGCSGQANK